MKKHLCLLAAFLLMALPSVPAVRAETPSAVSFARAEYWIAQKAVKEISILVEPEDAEDSYNVTVSDPAVLEAAHYYDERFKLKGLKPGDVTLALDTESGLHAECTVHVTAPVTEIRFTEENVVITRGQSHQFTVVATTEDGREYSNELVTFLSDPFYLSVDENGLATGVREWNTHIRADAGKEAFSRCKSLKSLTILTKKLNAKNVGKKAFEGLNAKVKVRCPKGKAKAYEKLLKACGLPATATVE